MCQFNVSQQGTIAEDLRITRSEDAGLVVEVESSDPAKEEQGYREEHLKLVDRCSSEGEVVFFKDIGDDDRSPIRRATAKSCAGPAIRAVGAVDSATRCGWDKARYGTCAREQEYCKWPSWSVATVLPIPGPW